MPHSTTLCWLLANMLLLSMAEYAQQTAASVITLSPKDAKVIPGGVVNFFCQASGNPRPHVYWRKNGKRVKSNRRYLVSDMSTGSVLRIKKAKEGRTDGTFECVADNGIGQPAVASATLDILLQVPEGYPRMSDRFSPEPKAVDSGRDTVLTCRTIANPDPVFTWLKDFLPMNMTDPRFTLLPQGSLQIQHVRGSDEGTYECVAENSVGVAPPQSTRLYVRVRPSLPYFVTRPESTEILRGSDLNLTCEAAGDPTPYVKWKLGSTQITPDTSIPLGINHLLLTDLQESGNYSCLAESELGIIEASAQVTVIEPPRITREPLDHKVIDHDVVSFFCEASGMPPPDIHWLRDGRRFVDNARHWVINMSRGSVLRIEPVRLRWNSSEFDCVAENGIGDAATARATLEIYRNINEAPEGYPMITDGPTLKAVEKGRNVAQICRTTGYPEPTVMWLKDDIPVNMSDPRISLLPEGQLRILQSREEDEGKYECAAENSVGVVYSYAANLYVRVRRVPPHFVIAPESREVMAGTTVNLTCAAVGKPMPYVRWMQGTTELTPEYSVPVGINNLILNNTRQSGNYTCVAASDLGAVYATAEVKVKGLAKPPTNVVLSEVTPSSVVVSWDSENDGPIKSYTIMCTRSNAQSEVYDKFTNITETAYRVTGLRSNTSYTILVVAVNNLGEGNPSNPVEFSTGQLELPTNLQLKRTSPSSVEVTWDAPNTPGVVGYRVYYSTEHVPDLRLWQSYDIGALTVAEINGLKEHTAYVVRVRARMSHGRYGHLSEVQWTNEANTELPIPTNLQLKRTSPSSVEVTWDAPRTPGVVGYRVYYSTENVPDLRLWQSYDIGALTVAEISGLKEHTAYVVRVIARMSDGGYGYLSEVQWTNEPLTGNNGPGLTCRQMIDRILQQISTPSNEDGHDESSQQFEIIKLIKRMNSTYGDVKKSMVELADSINKLQHLVATDESDEM